MFSLRRPLHMKKGERKKGFVCDQISTCLNQLHFFNVIQVKSKKGQRRRRTLQNPISFKDFFCGCSGVRVFSAFRCSIQPDGWQVGFIFRFCNTQTRQSFFLFEIIVVDFWVKEVRFCFAFVGPEIRPLRLQCLVDIPWSLREMIVHNL